MFQMVGQNKTGEEKLNEVKIRNLPDKGSKAIILKMIKELRRIDIHSDNFNRVRKYKEEVDKLRWIIK